MSNQALQRSEVAMQGEGLNMIVVDDNPMLVSVLSEIFRECGHDVRVASDGFLALAEIRKRVPDILLSDLSMPGMSGYELLSIVRRRFPEVRTIAMSGAHTSRSVPPGVAADAFYPKGECSIAQLIDMLRTIWNYESLSIRPAAPVWISEIVIDHARAAVMVASCPECLRPFPHRLGQTQIQQLQTCPHCLTVFELALVQHTGEMDGTPIMVPHANLPMGRPTERTNRSDGAPSGRMHQQ
jgi:CheY-like chemotaxis protein